jgi:hypothetical protein
MTALVFKKIGSLLIGCLWMGMAIAQAPNGAADGRDSYYQRAEASHAAYLLLRSIDKGDYAGLWSKATIKAKSGLNESAWGSALSGMRKVFGSYKDRTEIGYGFSDRMSSGERGVFYVVKFKTQFSGMTADEKLVLSYEDGGWRLGGYFLQPHGSQ